MSSRMLSSALRVQSQLIKRSIGSAVKVNFAKCSLPMVKTFHHSAINYNSNLKSVLKSEIKVSNEIPNELDAECQEYIKENNLEIIETLGGNSVHLKKTKDGEVIHVLFDVDEVTAAPLEGAEDAVIEEGLEEGYENDIDALDGMFSRVKIIVEKANTGLVFDVLLQGTESSFMIDNVSLEENVENSINSTYAPSNVYHGPSFSELDESLQTEFEEYLETRGLGDELAEFIVAYSEFKEENEYRNWLAKLTKFL